MSGPVDLYDAFGEHLRHCPLGALQALETVRHANTTAAYVPGTVKVYTYSIVPVNHADRLTA
jgi:hypothetical protein